jgi:hypothetical protein
MRYTFALLGSGLVTGALASTYVALCPMRLYEESYPMYEWAKAQAVRDERSAAEWLLLGDSRLKAGILPTALHPTALSLTLPGASPIELYYTAKWYLEHHPAPRRVLLSIAPIHFHSQFLFWDRAVKFDYLSPEALDEVAQNAVDLGDDSLGPTWRLPYDCLAYRSKALPLFLPELKATLFQGRAERNWQVLGDLEEDHGHFFFGREEHSDGLSFEAAHEHFRPTAVYDAYFRRLLGLLQRSGAEIRFQTMPLNRRSRSAIRADYASEYKRYFERVAKDFPTISFEVEWPVLPDDSFGDPNHLNAHGAELVTERVRERLPI